MTNALGDQTHDSVNVLKLKNSRSFTGDLVEFLLEKGSNERPIADRYAQKNHSFVRNWDAGTVSIIVFAVALFAATRGVDHGPPALLDWQVSSFADLGADEHAARGLHGDLHLDGDVPTGGLHCATEGLHRCLYLQMEP